MTTPVNRVRLVMLLIFVLAWMALQNPVLSIPFDLARGWFGIAPSAVSSTLRCAPYALNMVLRLVWWLIAVAVVVRYDHQVLDWIECSALQGLNFVKGLALGLTVMCATILAIVLAGDAQLVLVSGSVATHLGYAMAWLAAEILGAAGEELLYRVLILLLVMRLFGVRTAVLVSALAFSMGHLGNPGVSTIWLIRLLAAGVLLCVSVYRTGTAWWAVGYHAGWNFASAPLFGAAGSGYDDEGSQFHFFPAGSAWITGGAVGPEGSLFAFGAVALAGAVLLLTTQRRPSAPGLR